MGISFDLTKYSNTFPGEIIESDVSTASNGNYYMRIVIAVFDHNGSKMVQAVACPFANCTAQWIHRHQPSLFESDRSNSQIYKFLESVNVKGKTPTKTMTHKDFIGKVFLWESADVADGRKDDETGKRRNQTYFYVAGPDPRQDEDDTQIEPIVSAPATNGTTSPVRPQPITTEDKDILLTVYIGAEGKTFNQLMEGIVQNHEVKEFDSAYILDIVERKAIERLVDKLWIKIVGDKFVADTAVLQTIGA